MDHLKNVQVQFSVTLLTLLATMASFIKKYCNVTINLLKQMYDLHHRHICRPNLIDSFHGKL